MKTILTIALAILLSSCAVGGGYDSGYDGGVAVGFGLDYYEPYGGYYGGWGPNYHVAPYRGNDQRRDYHGNGGNHAYRSPNPSHSMPSLPSHSRSGGSRQHR
jgi:hypothetical protein